MLILLYHLWHGSLARTATTLQLAPISIHRVKSCITRWRSELLAHAAFDPHLHWCRRGLHQRGRFTPCHSTQAWVRAPCRLDRRQHCTITWQAQPISDQPYSDGRIERTLNSHHAAAVHIRPTHQWGIQRSCEGTRRPGVPAPPTRGANNTCRWRAHAVGQRQRGLALLQPKGIITRRAVAYGSLCWMRRKIWRFSSVIRISSRLRYSLFRLFPKLHRQTDRGMSSRKAKRGADAWRARGQGLRDDHASPRALSLPHGIAPGSEARGGRLARASGQRTHVTGGPMYFSSSSCGCVMMYDILSRSR